MNSYDADHLRRMREEIRPRLMKALDELADSVVSRNIREADRPQVQFGDAVLTFEMSAEILRTATELMREPERIADLSAEKIERFAGLQDVPRLDQADPEVLAIHLGICACVNSLALGYTLLESLLASAPESALDGLLQAIGNGEFADDPKPS